MYKSKDITPRQSVPQQQRQSLMALLRAMTPEERGALARAFMERAELTREMRASGFERQIKTLMQGAGGKPWDAYSPLESTLIATLYELDQLEKGNIPALSEPSQHALFRIAEEAQYIAVHGAKEAERKSQTVTDKPLRTRWMDLRRSVEDFGDRLRHEAELMAKYQGPVTAVRIQNMQNRKFLKWKESLAERREQRQHGEALLALLEPLVETLQPETKDAPGSMRASGRDAAWVDRTQQSQASEIER
jgi:hypothetical protein